jgi:hypothetical protein
VRETPFKCVISLSDILEQFATTQEGSGVGQGEAAGGSPTGLQAVEECTYVKSETTFFLKPRVPDNFAFMKCFDISTSWGGCCTPETGFWPWRPGRRRTQGSPTPLLGVPGVPRANGEGFESIALKLCKCIPQYFLTRATPGTPASK